MAGMRALGRDYDVVAPASGVDICLRDVSGCSLIAVTTATSACTLAFVVKQTFGGGGTNLTAPAFGQPSQWFSKANNNSAWVRNTSSWASNVLTIAGTAGNISQVDFLVAMLNNAAGGTDFAYLNVTAVNATLWAIPFDPTVSRKPELMRILAA